MLALAASTTEKGSRVCGIAPGHPAVYPGRRRWSSGERWSTKRGKPGQLAPRVHLRLIQCIIPLRTPPSPPPPRLVTPPRSRYIRRWLTGKRFPETHIDPAHFDAGQSLFYRASQYQPSEFEPQICQPGVLGMEERSPSVTGTRGRLIRIATTVVGKVCQEMRREFARP